MKPYRGIVKGNTVILEETPEGAEGSTLRLTPKGNVIRGGFGSTFRRIVCHSGCQEPETCELRNVCPYTAVFHPFVPEDSEKISKNRLYLVSQRILMRRSTDSNSGSPVKTVASSRWAVATQNASA
jgi:hypothetical protein